MKTGLRVTCLLLILMLFTACAEVNPIPPVELPSPLHSPTPEPPPPPLPPAPEHPEPPPYHATIEYGEPDLIKDNDGPLFTYIRFPQAGNPTDETIAEWARGVREEAWEEFEAVLSADAGADGEINVHFDSYLFDGRFAGIVEMGSFMHSHLAHPVDIVRTFNIDVTRQVFLSNSDIFDPWQTEGVLALLREQIPAQYPGSSAFLDGMDESWLSQIAIGHDGIVVVLERYVFLPGAFGTLLVTLPYGLLGSALILGAEQPPEPPPSPEPSPIPSPAPPPTPSPPVTIPIQSGEVDPSRPMVALTFDDGPSRYTPQILDILERYGARATFFTIGNLVNNNKDTVLRAVELGCEVAGHSWDHKDLTKLGEDQLRRQLSDTAATIEAITGIALPFFRPPYGAVNDRLKSVAGELGYALINWSVDPNDWRDRDADVVYERIMRDVRDRYIVLSHDLYGTTAQAMERVIPALLAQGYQLVTVSELLYHTHGGELEAGRVYTR
jgi:peptidoglycan/xylan/chitin deacetylase (PgdA/CDA1 family)